jgi:hypothetical protein
MGTLDSMLKVGGFFFKPLRMLRRRARKMRRGRRATGLGLGMALGSAAYRRRGRDKDYNSAFNQKYSSFMKYAKSNGVPNPYYNNFSSISKDSPDMDYTEKIKNSLEIVDRMHDDRAIGKKEYHSLKEKLYSDFKGELAEDSEIDIKNYLPLSASLIFFFSGILFVAPNLTGFSVMESLVKHKLSIFGAICLLFGIFFFGLFVRLKRKK